MEPSAAIRINRTLNKLSKLYRAAKARRLAELGLHPGQEVLLWILARERHGMTVSELAARLGVEPPTATRSLARLEDGGWFRREPVATDRRQVRIVVTDAGRALVPEIERAWADLAEHTLGDLDPADRETALTVLDQATSRLRNLVGDAALTED
ncbi:MULTISPECIES: MarR family winged helix-turn-helix transcriptional regulator [Actinoalloteichus]|uniref:DNA-binding transcriptional regulator, MarR family n=1 Tax=Actinoalloteichus caeruleus DSM 43889 TaxID=1120930 RepID=A0ABT1JD70_ACTCY|nr:MULTISPECIES: MarR family transcriptional regulator [Actinoalloteichus]MCP2330435.1 DNA-binding transcriptional regulator, MarR family [Actinoalloteichus caeruleus DSM 43889]